MSDPISTHPAVQAVISQAFAAKDDADLAKVDRDNKKAAADSSEVVLSQKSAVLVDLKQKAISLLEVFLSPGASDPADAGSGE